MKYSKRGAPLTRCSETLTDSAFFSKIRSHARKLSMFWKPKTDFLLELREPNLEEIGGKRVKFVYPCIACGQRFPLKGVQVDHIVPCGSVLTFEDIGSFYERLLVEKHGYQILCKLCHQTKTNEERRGRK